jgi:peptidyl-prolyl cis-trans isomerase D
MLKQLSRFERTQKTLIIGFAVLMAVSLVLFYKPGGSSSALSPATSNEVIAKVNGDEITVAQLAQLKEQYQQYFGGQISIAQLGGDKRLVENLVRDRVVAQEAARLGLRASDAEVRDAIVKRFTDEKGQFVGMQRYRETVDARYGGVENFERGIRDSISAEKLRAYVSAGVNVSEQEVLDDYKRKNTSFDVVYVPVTVDKLASGMTPSDDELRAYFDKHKTDYRINEPQKKIKYVFIDQAKSGEKLQIPDEDLKAEYEKLSPENKQAGVKVQEIVLKVARPDLDATVQGKAQDIVSKLRGQDGNVTEAAFAEAAKGNSEDPATAKTGGNVNGVVKKNPNKPDDPLQRALDMQEGAISDPIKYGNNYYIIRRGASVPKTFEDAKPELLVSLRNRRAYSVVAKLAERATQLLKETKDPQKVAQQLAGEANMNAADMVRETPYIKPGDDVPNIGSSQQFEQAIQPLNNAGDVGERTGVKNGFAVPMLVDKKEPRIPEYDEVKDKVAQAVKQDKAKQQLEQTARQLASSAGAASDLKAAATKLGLEGQSADGYKLGTPLGVAGTSPAADEVIYNLKAGEIAKEPVKIGDNWVVVGATKRTDADLAEFNKQRDTLMQSAVSERQSQVFEDYIGGVRTRLQSDGKIKIYDDVIARLADEEEPAALPRRPPVFPGQK